MEQIGSLDSGHEADGEAGANEEFAHLHSDGRDQWRPLEFLVMLTLCMCPSMVVSIIADCSVHERSYITRKWTL